MAKKSIEDKYKKLDDREHVLLRSSMYIGSTNPHKYNRYMPLDGTMVEKEIDYIPGFLKLFDEIIMNSVDESKRDGSKLNTIKVDIVGDKITVFDNGGIPVVIHKEEKQYVAEMIFSSLKAGSNFNDDEERSGSGLNGVGSSLVNIFSKEFNVSTCDGKKMFKQTFTDNMALRTKPKITKASKCHTEISYIPDLKRMNLEYIDDIHKSLIEKRVYDIAACNPKLKIYFNDKLIPFKSFEDYIKMYTKDYYYETNKIWSVGISTTNSGYKQISFVNSTETYDGGTHTDYIINQIITKLREFFKSKHKVDIKPSDIKNHLSVFIDSTIINPAFSSQTKEKLITEVKDFGSKYEVSEKMMKWILKSEIVASILDWVDSKKKADESKLTRELNKNLSKLKVDKLIDAKGKNRMNCMLFIFEGDSASGACRKFRDIDTQGSFSLRGKFINVSEIATQKLVQNVEAINLMGALGLKLGQKATKDVLRYGKIVLMVDADHDGNAIAGLLINFLYKYWPELFDYEMVYKAETPIVVSTNLKSKKKYPFYNQDEYNKWLSGVNAKDWEIKYKKGLSALTDDEYEEIICNPKLTLITMDKNSKEYLNVWFGKESQLRKDEILKLN